MSVGFYIMFIGLLTRRYIEQTPSWHMAAFLDRSQTCGYICDFLQTSRKVATPRIAPSEGSLLRAQLHLKNFTGLFPCL
jgi:hypothetical protein